MSERSLCGNCSFSRRDRGIALRSCWICLATSLVIWSLLACGCDRTKPAAAAGGAHTVASLVPAATDLIMGMGASNHLVAVSNYDDDPQTTRLPRVGDYQTIDWEKLAQIRPTSIITFYGPGRAPAGFAQRADELKIRQVNLKLDRLQDVYDSIGVLGEICGEPQKAVAMAGKIRQRVEAIHKRVAGEPRVRAVLVVRESGADLAGRDTFLDDLLTEAGGVNAVTASRYVTLDREGLAALRPQVVLLLLPGEDEKSVRRVKTMWESIAAAGQDAKGCRVCPLTQTYIEQPGSHVADAAESFAQALHLPREPASQPSATAAGAR